MKIWTFFLAGRPKVRTRHSPRRLFQILARFSVQPISVPIWPLLHAMGAAC
jgi:hypothetical protein